MSRQMTHISRWPSETPPGPLGWPWWASTPVRAEKRSSLSTWPTFSTMKHRENIFRWENCGTTKDRSWLSYISVLQTGKLNQQFWDLRSFGETSIHGFSKALVLMLERRGTAWHISPMTVHTHICTEGQYRVIIEPCTHLLGMWEDARVPGGNLVRVCKLHTGRS